MLRKRSEWLGRWNERQASVQSGAPGTGSLVWRGGSQPGSITLDGATLLIVQGNRIILRRHEKEWEFRAAAGGPALTEWAAAISAAARRASHDMGHVRQTPQQSPPLDPVPGPDAPLSLLGRPPGLREHSSERSSERADGGGAPACAGGAASGGARSTSNSVGADGRGEYEGECNAAGERQGRGTARYTHGDVYEGEWGAGKREGRGTYRYANIA